MYQKMLKYIYPAMYPSKVTLSADIMVLLFNTSNGIMALHSIMVYWLVILFYFAWQ